MTDKTELKEGTPESALDVNDIDNSSLDIIDIPETNEVDLRIEDVIAGGQAEISALRKEVQDSKRKLASAERSKLKAQDEAKRENQKSKKVLEEKRQILEKYKNLQSMFDGIDMETAKEVLRRAKEGEASDFESEAAKLIDSALSEFRETHHNPLVEELEDEKKTNEILRGKLHDAVIKSTIVTKAVNKGVDPSLAELVIPYFEKKMKIDEKGELKYLSKEGFEVENFDWDNSFKLLRNQKQRLFLPTKGSNANSSTNASSKSKDINPWLKATMDRTEQLRVMSEDPERAAKLKEEARKANRKAA